MAVKRGSGVARIAVLAALSLLALQVPAAASANDARQLCHAMQGARLDAAQPDRPGFLPSYGAVDDGQKLHDALVGAAFVYDNALAAIAFVACGDIAAARAIGDALAQATSFDRHYRDGRLRNAYRAGPVAAVPALPGWWDAGADRWAEDAYQVSSAVGNVAWAGLALLHLHNQTGEVKYLEAAERLGGWLEPFADGESAPGLTGGFYGFEPGAARITWKSTEHNIDTVAFALWLFVATKDPRWDALAANALDFLKLIHDAERGFRIGTDPQGVAVRDGPIVLDAQLWPLLALPPTERPAAWNATLGLVDKHLGVAGNGFDFNDDRDGMWVEGTAQAALVFSLEGDAARASQLLAAVMAQRDAQSGLLFATREEAVSTGLTIDAAGEGGEFRYYRWPHLGATAWAVLAALNYNPFRPD